MHLPYVASQMLCHCSVSPGLVTRRPSPVMIWATAHLATLRTTWFSLGKSRDEKTISLLYWFYVIGQHFFLASDWVVCKLRLEYALRVFYEIEASTVRSHICPTGPRTHGRGRTWRTEAHTVRRTDGRAVKQTNRSMDGRAVWWTNIWCDNYMIFTWV